MMDVPVRMMIREETPALVFILHQAFSVYEPSYPTAVFDATTTIEEHSGNGAG